MSRVFWILTVLLVVLGAMGFAAVNTGNRVTLSLGIITLYQVPVTLVAFSGLFVGMLVMFATGIHSDLKIRRILRDRLAEEARHEQTWFDRNQQDLFAENARVDPEGVVDPIRADPTQANPTQANPPQVEPTQVEPPQVEPPQVEPTQASPTPEGPIIE